MVNWSNLRQRIRHRHVTEQRANWASLVEQVRKNLEDQRNAPGEEEEAVRDKMVEELEARYGKPKIVLSFGARDGGALFAQWLREELRRRKGYAAAQNAVYLDTIALQNNVGTKLTMRTIVETPMRTSRLWNSHSMVPTAGGLASMNQAWRWYYKYAVKNAHTMIFMVTKAWSESSYCRDELDIFKEENERRGKKGRDLLKGICLKFEDGLALAAPNMQVIEARKVYVVSDQNVRNGLTGNYRDLWILNDEAMTKLMASIPPYAS